MHHRVTGKHWIRIWGLTVVVVGVVAVSAVNSSCVDTATNFCEKYGVRCKADQQCALNQAVCIQIGGCGDGVIDKNKGEICDDGNVVNGNMVDGKFVLDTCSHDCQSTQECGNEIQDIGEACDHGKYNGVSADPCDINCQIRSKVCGDGIVDIGEQCDPGMLDSAGCNSFLAGPALGCKFPKCGDGYPNIMTEECDRGGMITADCNGYLCTRPICGDHFQNLAAGEDCDNGNLDTTGCNGDGNDNSNNDLSKKCHIPFCGDGYTNSKFKPPGSKNVEQCDTHGDSLTCNGDGNGDDRNNDDSRCQVAVCGDGYTNRAFTPPGATLPEECDNGRNDTKDCNGNNSGSDGPGSCRIPSCGDGYVNPKFPTDSNGEQCDPGNVLAGIPGIVCKNGKPCMGCRC